MNERLRELELRQRALVLRSDLQRLAIADEGAAIEARIAGVEGKVALARQLVSWPVLGLGATLALAFAGPRRVLRLASRALVFATLARRAWGLVGVLKARARPDGRGAPPGHGPG
ncbi:MAG: hypothetical protein U1F18_03245 [Steroidobacteraceae bacterium]